MQSVILGNCLDFVSPSEDFQQTVAEMLFPPLKKKGYELHHSISEQAIELAVSCVRWLSDTAPNTQLDGYGILALIQALTNTFLPTESTTQSGVALFEPLHPNNTPQWWMGINRPVGVWRQQFLNGSKFAVCWTTKFSQPKKNKTTCSAAWQHLLNFPYQLI